MIVVVLQVEYQGQEHQSKKEKQTGNQHGWPPAPPNGSCRGLCEGQF